MTPNGRNLMTDRAAIEYAAGLLDLAALEWGRLDRDERRAFWSRPVVLPDGRGTTWGELTTTDLRWIAGCLRAARVLS
jgi:hypothetical protein